MSFKENHGYFIFPKYSRPYISIIHIETPNQYVTYDSTGLAYSMNKSP